MSDLKFQSLLNYRDAPPFNFLRSLGEGDMWIQSIMKQVAPLIALNIALISCTTQKGVDNSYDETKLYEAELIVSNLDGFDYIEAFSISEDGTILIRAQRHNPFELVTLAYGPQDNGTKIGSGLGRTNPGTTPIKKLQNNNYTTVVFDDSGNVRAPYPWLINSDGQLDMGLDLCGLHISSVSKEQVMVLAYSDSGEFAFVTYTGSDGIQAGVCEQGTFTPINLSLNPNMIQRAYLDRDGEVLLDIAGDIDKDIEGGVWSSRVQRYFANVELITGSSNGHVLVRITGYPTRYQMWRAHQNLGDANTYPQGIFLPPRTQAIAVSNNGDVLAVKTDRDDIGLYLTLWRDNEKEQPLTSLISNIDEFDVLKIKQSCTPATIPMNGAGDILLNCKKANGEPKIIALRRK